MNLLDVVRRQCPPEPWGEGEKIPWNDPDFSERMLKEHLSQSHDLATRRLEKVAQHVAWLHEHVLSGKPGRILDLACGPGLYSNRLAELGHHCVGIDFGPASIRYAREKAEGQGTNNEFIEADIREAEFGHDFDLVMLIYGEFNVFRKEHACLILKKAERALKEKGVLLLEVQNLAAVRETGSQAPYWAALGETLFSDRPHVCLTERFWDEERKVATERYYTVDASSGEVRRYASSTQGYSEDEYRSLLKDCGLKTIEFFPSLMGEVDESQAALSVIVATH